MKQTVGLILAIFVLAMVPEATAQTVIDETGLKVNGEAISPGGFADDGMRRPGLPEALWIGQWNGYLWSCDAGGVCTLQADLGKRIFSMAVFNSMLWVGQAEGDMHACDSSGVCRRLPSQGADVARMQVYDGRLWLGLASGELKSCDSGGNCSSLGDQGEAILSMKTWEGKLWIGQDDGQLRACDAKGTCKTMVTASGAILEMAPFGGKLWLGLADGTLKACDSAAVCTEHDKRPEPIRAMVVFDNKLWVGRTDGYLKSCSEAGTCGELWDYGGTIDDMVACNGWVWIAQGAQLRSAFEPGTFDYHGDLGANIGKLAAFKPAGLGRTIHSRWNCVGTRQGCVGIGIANPGSLLHIHQADETARAYLTFSNPATGSSDGNGVSIGLDPNEDFRIDSHEENNILFYTQSEERLRIDSKGNVGVGTDSPAGRLDVNGPIYQRGKKLHADYVFDPSYRIESIEAHAEAMWREKHLEAVPKVRYDENGLEVLEVGAHRRGMLEELEKAHVYIQQLNEQVKSLQARNAALERVVCEMRPDADPCRHEAPTE